jgi:hypothetical protein
MPLACAGTRILNWSETFHLYFLWHAIGLCWC